MTTGTALTEIHPPQIPSKENSIRSTKILSKIARSPTAGRKHRPVASQDYDGLPEHLSVTQGAAHSRRNQPRPGFLRQISAPDTSVLPIVRADETIKHFSDATGQTAQQAKAMLNQQSSQLSHPSNPSISNRTGVSGGMFSAPLVSEHIPLQNSNNGLQGVNFMYQQLHELAQKRIATLQYMKKTHEGKLFWFNTVQFTRIDISRMQSYAPGKLSRRATNFFLLGLSIPAVLDIYQIPHQNSSPQTCTAIAMEYLKGLNTLLAEFESYQEKHPTDGSHAGSLSRARLPSMFKRSATVSRPRKSSSAPSIEIGAQISPPAVPDTPHALHHSSKPSMDTTATGISRSGTDNSTSTTQPRSAALPSNGNFSATATFPPPGPADAPNSSLLPNEALYTHLLTPPLPFAPDFYTVFSTLCDVLIDTYQRLLQILHVPSACNATVMDIFGKADARIRRVMVGGIIKDFGDSARDTAKRELSGVQRVVMGPLMG